MAREGVPRNPAGWLHTVGRRRAVDAFRRRAALDAKYAVLANEEREDAVTGDWDRTRSTTTCSR